MLVDISHVVCVIVFLVGHIYVCRAISLLTVFISLYPPTAQENDPHLKAHLQIPSRPLEHSQYNLTAHSQLRGLVGGLSVSCSGTLLSGICFFFSTCLDGHHDERGRFRGSRD